MTRAKIAPDKLVKFLQETHSLQEISDHFGVPCEVIKKHLIDRPDLQGHHLFEHRSASHERLYTYVKPPEFKWAVPFVEPRLWIPRIEKIGI